MNNNLRAFLRTIRYSEGTSGANGYNIIFGGTESHPITFESFADHPRRKVTAGGFTSDAAGAYQFLSKTWDYLNKKLHLVDFSPESQDMACIELFKQNNAYNLILIGSFDTAIARLNRTWASLPNSPYGQPTHPLRLLRDYYVKQGGVLNQSV